MAYSHSKTLKAVKQIVKKELGTEPTGHGYWHSFRVCELARKIAQTEGGDIKILDLAAWLHDIAVKKGRKHHHTLGAKQTEKILAKLNVPDPIKLAVVDCVLKHRYSTNYKLTTIEQKIIQDADNIDALGAIIIPRIFAHCGHYGIPIYDPSIKPSVSKYLKTGHSTTGINHFYEKLFKIPSKLNTKTAKRMAKQRVEFLKTFLNQYLAEFKGLK